VILKHREMVVRQVHIQMEVAVLQDLMEHPQPPELQEVVQIIRELVVSEVVVAEEIFQVRVQMVEMVEYRAVEVVVVEQVQVQGL
jgi:hypothetical protein